MGFPADLKRVLELGARYGVPVVEDAACAAGSAFTNEDAAWELVGRPRGQTACFSFHPRKLLTTGDGGMITTSESELDARFRMLRHHGMDVSDEVRHRADEVIVERYVETGHNYRMTDIQAAMGLVQLGKLDENIAGRRHLAESYAGRLDGIPGLQIPRAAGDCRPNWQSYPVRLLEDAPLDQAELMRRLLRDGIASRPGIMNAHQQAPYRDAGWSLPRSEAAREQVLVETVAAAIRRAFGL